MEEPEEYFLQYADDFDCGELVQDHEGKNIFDDEKYEKIILPIMDGDKKVKMKTYIFKTNLLHDLKIIREIEMPENINLYRLAEAIVGAYGFDFDHCFGFFSKIAESGYFDSEKQYDLFADLPDVEPTGAGSVKKTKINKVWKNTGDKMLFLFDYGDHWQFVVELKGVGKKDQNKKYPRILKKIGRAPRQY